MNGFLDLLVPFVILLAVGGVVGLLAYPYLNTVLGDNE